MTLRFLVVDGNNAAGRARQHDKLGRTAGAGYSDVLRQIEPAAACTIVCPADEDAVMPSRAELGQFDAVVLTGSALHLWQGEPEVMRQVAFAQRVFETGMPFFGSCWGLQVATVAAGGRVEKNPMGREAGFARAIAVNQTGRDHPLLSGRPMVFDAPCMHLDAVTEPAPGTTILAANDMAIIQAAEIHHAGGCFWGVQYHPEFSISLVARLLRANAQLHVEEGRFADEDQLMAYCADLDALCADPVPGHATWRYGIGPEILNRERRVTEIRNFIDHRVRPYVALRRAA